MMRITSAAAVLWVLPAMAHAALYWEAGVLSNKPTVCFVGDALSARPDRVAQIKGALAWFEEAANIRFQYLNACTSVPKPNGDDHFGADIRVVIPNTSWGSTADVFAALNPIPGKGCGQSEGGGGWSNSPADLNNRRACLFNLHLGDDAFAEEIFFGQPP